MLLIFFAVLASQPVRIFAAEGSACAGVIETLKWRKDMAIINRLFMTTGYDILFGPDAEGSFTIFVPTEAAWAAAAKTLGINLKNPTAADKNTLIALFFYNAIAGSATYIDPTTMYNGKTMSALGEATSKNLPLTFTRACPGCSVFVHGATGSAILRRPIHVCGSLIYITDTVLLPSMARAKVIAPSLTEIMSLVYIGSSACTLH